jgi:hypothetical protein
MPGAVEVVWLGEADVAEAAESASATPLTELRLDAYREHERDQRRHD